MTAFPFSCRMLGAFAFFLFAASMAFAAEKESDQAAPESAVASGSRPDTASAFTPEAPPEACRDCELQYYRPSAPGRSAPLTPPLSRQGRGPSKTASDVPVSAVSGRSHLSSDPRVKTARALVQRNRFAQALKILRPLAASDHPDQTDVRFLMGLAASRGAQTSGVEDEIRLALLDEAIWAFRSILIRRPGLVRVRLELALAFYLKEEDGLARGPFRAHPGGPAARGPGRPTSPGF